MVELALVLPILVLLLAGMVDYSLQIQQRMRLTAAASAGAAWATRPGAQSDLAGARATAIAAAAGIPNLQAAAVSFWTCTAGGAHVSSATTCSGTCTPMHWVQVDLTAQSAPLLPISGLPTFLPLHATAIDRVAWSPE